MKFQVSDLSEIVFSTACPILCLWFVLLMISLTVRGRGCSARFDIVLRVFPGVVPGGGDHCWTMAQYGDPVMTLFLRPQLLR